MRYDSRAALSDRMVPLSTSANTVTFDRDDLTFYARSGASTTALSGPAYTALPIGLRFTLDNSNGSGSMTLTPATGTATVVAAGKIYQYQVAASGVLKAGELAAAPT